MNMRPRIDWVLSAFGPSVKGIPQYRRACRSGRQEPLHRVSCDQGIVRLDHKLRLPVPLCALVLPPIPSGHAQRDAFIIELLAAIKHPDGYAAQRLGPRSERQQLRSALGVVCHQVARRIQSHHAHPAGIHEFS